MHVEIPDEALPEEAFNWGIEKGVKDFEVGEEINAVMGVQIVILEEYRGKGISSIAAEKLKTMCIKMGMKRLIILVRPTLKSIYPLNDIENYINWKNKDGLPFDPCAKEGDVGERLTNNLIYANYSSCHAKLV